MKFLKKLYWLFLTLTIHLISLQTRPTLQLYSWGLNSTQRNWDTREKELFAIKKTLEADNSSLLYLDRPVSPKIQRWAWLLSQYCIDFIHIAGTENTLAVYFTNSIKDLQVPKISITPKVRQCPDKLFRHIYSTCSFNTDFWTL